MTTVSNRTERFVMRTVDDLASAVDQHGFALHDDDKAQLVAEKVREQNIDVLSEMFWITFGRCRDEWMERQAERS